MQAPFFIAAILILEIVFGISPKADRMTWVLENVPVWIVAVVLTLTYKKFPLSRLCLLLLSIHALILMVGGHYTYAKVPIGDWVKDQFGLARNHYDRLGHFAQGFIPAILVRELLVRTAHLRHRFWLPFLAGSVCLAFSAFYELFEWWTALATGEGAKDFLGTQGDIWDTQWDMFCALIGAITALLILPGWHERSMQKLPSPPA
ncbi:MAG: rane protein [Verrucomicrobiales bacterium]|nr:rane protein [Verrucomicrobiales bacterium]